MKLLLLCISFPYTSSGSTVCKGFTLYKTNSEGIHTNICNEIYTIFNNFINITAEHKQSSRFPECANSYLLTQVTEIPKRTRQSTKPHVYRKGRILGSMKFRGHLGNSDCEQGGSRSWERRAVTEQPHGPGLPQNCSGISLEEFKSRLSWRKRGPAELVDFHGSPPTSSRTVLSSVPRIKHRWQEACMDKQQDSDWNDAIYEIVIIF